MFKPKIDTVANRITVARMFLGGLPPAVLIYYFHDRFWWVFAYFFWIVFWEISDILDGSLARRSGEVSELGKLLDPLADIKMHIPLLIVLAWFNETCPIWAVLIIVMRELSITGGRAGIATLVDGKAMGSRTMGKVKTWGYALSILYGVAFIAFATPDSPFPNAIPLFTVQIFFYVVATISLYTWIEYGYHFWKVIRPLLKSP